MKFIMKVTLFRVPVLHFIFKDVFIIIRHYFSYIIRIFVVYLLNHIRSIRLSGDIEPNPRSYTKFSTFNLLIEI